MMRTAASTSNGKRKYAFSSPLKSLHRSSSSSSMDFKYSHLEKYFEVQRMEHEAARAIQKIWKRSRMAVPWRRAIFCHKMAIRIQRRFRGMLTRRYVAEWFFRRTSIVITWQAHVRRYLTNLHNRPILQRDQDMAMRIQRAMRCRIARRYCSNLLRHQAAVRIQAVWRGLVDRLKADRMWLTKQVVCIQNAYRGRIAQQRYGRLRSLKNESALIIQKKFRHHRSVKTLGDRLFDREVGYRSLNVQVLNSEEAFYQEKLTKGMERLVKNNLKDKCVQLYRSVQDCEAEIYISENYLIEYQRQLETLSPRAREQLYHITLAQNITDTRQKITELKLKCLFELSPAVFKQDEKLEDQVRAIEQYAACRDRVDQSRSAEYEDKRHVTYKREILRLRHGKRFGAADERRRWQVRYFSRDGKPDKQRRPGRPWEAAVFAGPDKATYSGNNVNLLAANNIIIGKGGGASVKSDTIKSIESTLDQVGLQTYLEEVKLYEQLLNPIAEIMKNTMGITPMGTSNLDEHGWGSEGSKIIPALHDIGIISSQKMQLLTNATTGGTSRRGNTKASVLDKLQRSKDQLHSSATAAALAGAPSSSSRAKRSTLLRLGSALSYKDEDLLERREAPKAIKHDRSRNNAQILAPLVTPFAEKVDDQLAATLPQHHHHQMVFAALKEKKLRSRKSYLPALDAHIERYHQPPSTKNDEFMEYSYSMVDKYNLDLLQLRDQSDDASGSYKLVLPKKKVDRPLSTPKGARLGSPHTARLGSPHGARLGSPHGARLGSPHGARLGSPHGARLGSPHGARLGSPHGARLGNPHDSHIGMTSSRKRALQRQSIPREIVVPTSVTAAVVSVEHKQPPRVIGDHTQEHQASMQEYSRDPKSSKATMPPPVTTRLPLASRTLDMPRKTSPTATGGGCFDSPPRNTDDDSSSSIAYYHDDDAAHRQARQEEARVRGLQVQKRRDRKLRGRRSGAINWELIDQIDGLKRRFENEKSYIEFNFKY